MWNSLGEKELCIRLYKTEDCYLSACLSVCHEVSVCLSVLLMNKTSTNSFIFYFDKAKQKNVCSGYLNKYSKIFCFVKLEQSIMH